jgi:hypothetical protein
MDPGVTFMWLNFGALFAVVIACWLVNLLLRRPTLNGWYWGLGAVIAMSGYIAWRLTNAGAFDADDAYRQGDLFGNTIGGPALFPVLLALWLGRRFRNRTRSTAGDRP